ncbi:transcriptional regulator family: Fungal Specific TF [Penicillium verhagenii]|uniref:transcriptional regulator family: Fungal Specific TF n=1 Tax=Penicillium verhagenii TaxID=1562060 RepID=UPI002544FEE7|nr:transcriptional regulator family: Fungal Specific TF [Penicillium verhagenii]KAJ5924386.1 transcriptional regulator family: Fungal Specific TF [Penicillium verhagenii]
MASPSSPNTRLEDESDWQYGPRATKRRKQASTPGASKPSPREIGYMRESQNDGSASFLGSSSGIHFVRHVYGAFARRSADLQQTRAGDRSSVPGEDDRLQRDSGHHDTNELWTKQEVDNSPNNDFTFEDLVHWTRPYFENWHPIFPCLHAPTILKAMEALCHHGLCSIKRLDLIVIRCLVSVSLADTRQVQSSEPLKPVPGPLLFLTMHNIMQEIQSLLAEPTTLPLLQAAFTVQLTLTALLRLNAASRVGGIITRTAFHLGLHRCPGRFSCFSSEEVDIRRRLFWSIYSLERYLSQALGVPLSIRDDDIDVCYPGAERHVDPPNHCDAGRLQLLCHLAKFARIRGLILELRNKSILHSHAGTFEASHVNGELSQWWNEVYDDVNPIEDNSDTPGDLQQNPIFAPYHRLLLMVLRHEAIISMNRPLLAAEKPNPDYKNALQTCIGSSRSLLAALRKFMSSSSDTPLTWPSFTWTTWMACLILMYASWEGELPVATALKYARMGISVLEHLALRGSSWPETCIEAIKSMESALLSNIGSQETPSSLVANDRILTRNQTGSPRNLTPRRSVGGIPTLASSDNQGTNSSQVDPPSMTAQRFRTPANPANSGQPPDSAIIPPHDNHGPAIDLPVLDVYSSNGQTSAGLIFGNMANTHSNIYSGNIGQESQPFSDASFFMNDLWSVADGPWIIDGNFL